MEPKSPSKLKLPIAGFTQYKRVLKISIIVLVVLLLLVGAYTAFKLVKYPTAVGSSYHTVVVDCGSTGTRVNVYEWKKSGLDNQDLPVLVRSYPDNLAKSLLSKSSCHYHCMQTEPGLDKYVGNASGVRASLEPLIIWAKRWVPRERHGDTPIFVLATAGLRSLAIEDARQVLDDMEAVVKEHSFMYRKNWIRVLSGNEEAYYGWVALNYKMGILGNSSKEPTWGLLDLGGSSLQVVMEVDDARDDKNSIRSKIGSVEHQILAYSLSSFGLNEAFDRTVVMLSQVQPLKKSIGNRLKLRHPCLSSDFVQNYTCNHCIGLGISDEKNLSSQIQKTDVTSTYLVGDLNWEQCKGLARSVAINSSSLDWSQSTIGTHIKGNSSSYSSTNILNLTAVAHPTRRFHALSGFFVVYNMLNLSPRANLTKIWEEGQQLCSRPWADLSSISGNQNYAGQYCFRVPYMASIIEDALCLGDTEIVFGPGDVSWTLGAALVEGEYFWHSTSEARTGVSSLKSIAVISSPISLFVLLLCVLFIVYYSQIKLPMPGKKGAAAGASLPSYIYPKRRPN